jgi:CYTH domain-containing protein
MKTERRFLIGPSLVRLIQRERIATKDFVEGYLQSSPELTHFVRLEADVCHIVLQTFAQTKSTEERTRIPTAQADALLDVCAGKVVYRRTEVRLGHGPDAFLDRFEHPGGLNLLAVEFDDQDQANGFSPPAWFGPEVTQDPAYRRQSIAMNGLPSSEEVEVGNAAVNALLDTLEADASADQPLSAISQPPAEVSTVAPETARDAPERMPPAVPFKLPSPAPAPAPTPASAADVPPEPPAPHPGFEAIMTGLAQAIETGAASTEAEAKEAHPAPKVQVAEAIPLLKRLRG